MPNQKRKHRRAKQRNAKKPSGFLSVTGMPQQEIEAQERNLRAALAWDIEPEEADVLPEPIVLTQEQEAAPEAPEEEFDLWPELLSMPVDAPRLRRNLIITAARKDPSHAAFDVLRTRLVQALGENNWRRVAITSPTRDCGKTFVAANLAISLSRYESSRTLLMDMDMRNPSVAKALGVTNVGSMGDYLRGLTPTEDQFHIFDQNTLNIGPNLAIAMNDRVEPYAGELLQDPLTAERLEQMEKELHPDVVLFDLPPALANDDVIAFDSNFDGLLIVIDGTRTSGAQVQEVMRRVGPSVPLLGVVLNKAEEATGDEYGY
ncbi:MAG: CpsD/CapB family tyrosine-protein kinase [Thalassovita sp.]